MNAFWFTLVGLLVAASALLLLGGRRADQSASDTRDALNKRFYYQRLRELEEDEAQGVVGERAVMVRELQQSLLTDIPVTESSGVFRTQSGWILLPGVLVMMIISFGLYLKTGGFVQFVEWQQVQHDLPALRARVMDPQAKPLSMEELARFGLGVRSELQRDPRNLNDWMLLGRIGMVMNNASTATQAFQHALQLAPNNKNVRLSYAEVLTRSNDPEDNRQGGEILNAMLAEDGKDVSVLSLLAFNAFEQQHYSQAIAVWQKMLSLIPADDGRVAVIERSIEKAKTDAGLQTSRLSLTVNIAPNAEKMLPEGGVMYISVSDGVSPVPVAVKKLPLSHFPLSLTLDDSNAMMPQRLLSALHQVQVRVRLSRDGRATPQSGDWFGESAVMPYDGHQQLAVEINQQQP
ncbi:Cytochrome c heme lyase subunit CcmH [Paramixta manurensis]|uniref:Cytochrome c heme lyase subunit CcmH n=1 Tax=Paramixta manurensis TaxID=2740817 RepID=A0A6M8UHX1_9GAMM|nr:Cytochrome c heme lyase subunit CcmH [Erwiniaceae bacterium PD-1]